MADGDPISNNRPSLRAAIGMHVEIDLVQTDGATEQLAVDIVADRFADLSAGFLGAGTPLGKALIGQRAGRVIPYQMADIHQVRIRSVTASQRAPDPEAAETREALVRDAVRKSDLEDSVRLALTVNVKWGDYDPEGIMPDDK